MAGICSVKPRDKSQFICVFINCAKELLFSVGLLVGWFVLVSVN